MSDNVQANAATTSGAIFKTDQDAGDLSHAPFTKLMFGALNTFTVVASNQGLPVEIVAAISLPVTGTFYQATQPVSIAASVAVTGAFYQATQPVSIASTVTVTGVGGSFPVTDSGGSLTIDAPVGTPAFVRLSDGTAAITTLPVSLASVPSHAVTNAGTFAVQVDGAALTSLQLIDDAVSGAGFNITQFGGVNVAMGNGVTSTGTQRVTLSNDGTGILAGITTVTTLTTCSTVTNLSQLGGVAPSKGNGTSDTGVLRVAQVSDGTGVVGLNAGTNLVGKVGIDQTTSGTTNAVVDIPCTTGGLSVSSFLSTAAVQSTSIKGSAGQVYSLEFFNIGATPMYVRLYNKATTDDGSGTPVWRGIIPGNTAGAGFVKTWGKGLAFGTGIAMRCTGAIADADTTVLAANTVIGNVTYK